MTKFEFLTSAGSIIRPRKAFRAAAYAGPIDATKPAPAFSVSIRHGKGASFFGVMAMARYDRKCLPRGPFERPMKPPADRTKAEPKTRRRDGPENRPGACARGWKIGLPGDWSLARRHTISRVRTPFKHYV